MYHNPVTEAELKSKATGRRVTLEDVNDAIASEHFFTAGEGVFGRASMEGMAGAAFDEETAGKPLDLLTFCTLVLTNGYTVTGQSACADPSNFNPEIGRRIAREDAVKKIWPLLGFQLREDMARDQDLVGKRAFNEMPGFGVFIGTKVVHAIPMSRAIYNDFRGWTMPENETDDAGYLVEYTDGGQANVEGYAGYISWSPKEVFERSYRAVGQDASASEPAPGREGAGARDPKEKEKKLVDNWATRLRAERLELSERCAKLGAFLSTDSFSLLPRVEQSDLLEQKRYMDGYLMILNYRLGRVSDLPDMG